MVSVSHAIAYATVVTVSSTNIAGYTAYGKCTISTYATMVSVS